MNRHKLLLITSPILLIVACSRDAKEDAIPSDIAVSEASEVTVAIDVTSENVAHEPSAMKAPGIPASAAPNLAFEFRYAFKLPDAKIGEVQEEHAEACEALGTARCQIVDMKYQQIDEDRAEAMLAFKLDPAIARNFGREAIASVENAEGVLADGNVTGTNVGGEIEDSQARSAMLVAQLERLEKRLATKGLPAKERASLHDRAEELRKELDGEEESRRLGEGKLAMTPVQFTYFGDDGLPGFGRDNPFANAFEMAASSFATMVSFVLLVVGGVLPWALLVILIVALLRTNAAKSLRIWWSKSSQFIDEPLKD